MNLFLRAVVCLLLCFSASAPAQFGFGDGDQVKASLLADTETVVPGKPFTVLVRLEIKEKWHVYWQFGGDSGAPPKIEWELPEGFSAGPIQWPIPKRHVDEGDLVTYVYEGDLLLPIEITPPANVAAEQVALKAKLSWLVCSDICVPGRGEVSLNLPVSQEAKPANTEAVNAARARLPRSEPPPFKAAWEIGPEVVKVTLSGLPAEAKVELFPLPPNADVRPKPVEAGKPSDSGERTFTIPVAAGGAKDTQWEALVVAEIGSNPRTGWMIAPTSSGSSSAPASAAVTSTSGGRSFATWLLIAFAGGLVLNLMPCVLPVIALKIFSFVNQAGQDPKRVFHLGLAFVAGVFVFFLGIAGLAIGLQMAGRGFFWGMQFADPRLMLGLIGLVVIFAMAMFGVFEITLGGSAENTLGTLSRKEGLGGAFIHGLFTTLLGTSCTAPLVGSALGYAVTLPPALTILMFVAMAAGMSLPYFLLTWHPAWMRYLPKPGAWMERFKQLMGFVLLAVAVWLLGVLGKSRGAEAAAAASWLMLFLGLGAWIFGASGRRWWGTILALLVIGVGAKFFLADAMANRRLPDSGPVITAGGIPWQAFSPEAVEKARAANQPVFIDFTAEWCINCKVNEGGVLSAPAVIDAFKQKGVVPFKADWTNFDPVISEWLKKFQRIGVPLYVLYRPGEAEPQLFPELLTQAMIIDAVSGIAAKP